MTPASQLAQPEVLTLEETAQYLRLPVETVEQQAAAGKIPGRKIEDTWRFLKRAIDDWLRAQDKPQAGRASLLQQAGALKDDPYLDELLATIYRDRGRPEADIAEAQ